MSSLLAGDALIALVTLTTMEIVLGIDNVVFIAILTARLPAAQQGLARRLGIGLALVIRIGLLFAISWMMGLTRPLVSVPVWGHEFSGRDLILLGGGLFLIAKATWEIYDKLEVADAAPEATGRGHGAFLAVLAQILVLDIVFSLDSVITAVGMANDVTIMVIAMVIAMLVMLVSARPIGAFVEAPSQREDPRPRVPPAHRRHARRRGHGISTWARATSTRRWRSRSSSSCSTCATAPSASPCACTGACGRTSRGRRVAEATALPYSLGSPAAHLATL